MPILEKVTDILLSKNWIITLLSFVVSVFISIFIPDEVYSRLPFESKVNVIVGFAAIMFLVFLVMYTLVWLVSTNLNKSKKYSEYQKIKNKEAEENIEQWRCFFDRIDDEEYSILMFFVITQNQRPYKRWGYRQDYFKDGSIFAHGMVDRVFYKTTAYEESPPYLVYFSMEKKPMMTTSKGNAEIFTMKDDFYNLLVEIINRKGSLSHHPRKTYKLDYGNGADLPEFQKTKFESIT